MKDGGWAGERGSQGLRGKEGHFFHIQAPCLGWAGGWDQELQEPTPSKGTGAPVQ